MEIKLFLVWYLAFFVFGIIGLPITSRIFKNWPDKGYGFAKFIGLFVVAMPLWFLASLSIIKFSAITAWLFVIIAFAAAVYVIVNKDKIDLRNKHIIVHEVAFLVMMLVWAIIRGSMSRVEGTEKFMNLAFMASIDRSEYFPPADPWLSGETINYYYLGHYLFTFVGKICFMGVNYAYNLALITIISQLLISCASVIAFLVKKFNLIFGYLGALWITIGGNLHYCMFLFAKLFSDEWAVKFLPPDIQENFVTGQQLFYYFPNATRIIPFAIDEFPAYSVVLGDVHGHYLGIPFIVIVVALALASFQFKLGTKAKLYFNCAVSFLLVALYGINSWDFITANFIFLVFHVFQALRDKKIWADKIIDVFYAELALILPGFVLMLPYFLNFNAPLVGEGKFIIDKFIGFTPAFLLLNRDKVKVDKLREIAPWLLMWGMFLFITVSYYLARSTQWLNLKEKIKKSIEEDYYKHLLVFISLCLILGVEFFFFKDIFHTSNPPFYRTNTVFKFYYQAWVIWGIAATALVAEFVFYFKNKYRVTQLAFLFIIGCMYVGSLMYIHKAVTDFYPDIRNKTITLDGNYYIKIEEDKKGDYAAIQWIKENIDGQPIIAEAVGDAYTYFARISTNTGLKTVVGWPTHEWQWRGDATEAFARKGDVEKLYTTTNESEFLDIVNKYSIDYIFVGSKELTTYTALNETLMKKYATIVFDDQQITKIYKLNKVVSTQR